MLPIGFLMGLLVGLEFHSVMALPRAKEKERELVLAKANLLVCRSELEQVKAKVQLVKQGEEQSHYTNGEKHP
jgi:hypothetical protein